MRAILYKVASYIEALHLQINIATLSLLVTPDFRIVAEEAMASAYHTQPVLGACLHCIGGGQPSDT